MSRLEREHEGAARRTLAYNNLYLPREAKFVEENHYALYRHAASIVGSDQPVTYLEFGVANGNSLKHMTELFTNKDSVFVGFDSFIGLPESWMMHERGAFSNNGTVPDIDDSRVKFVTGWFQNTLHTSFDWLQPLMQRSVLVHFDADLYYSTLFLLSSLWPKCADYHFIMDDFLVDDIVALHDFSLAYPVDIDFITRLQGGLPHSILGRIRRKEFSLE